MQSLGDHAEWLLGALCQGYGHTFGQQWIEGTPWLSVAQSVLGSCKWPAAETAVLEALKVGLAHPYLLCKWPLSVPFGALRCPAVELTRSGDGQSSSEPYSITAPAVLCHCCTSEVNVLAFTPAQTQLHPVPGPTSPVFTPAPLMFSFAGLLGCHPATSLSSSSR